MLSWPLDLWPGLGVPLVLISGADAIDVSTGDMTQRGDVRFEGVIDSLVL